MEKKANAYQITAWTVAASLAPLAIAAPESGIITNLWFALISLGAIALADVLKTEKELPQWVHIVNVIWVPVVLLHYLNTLSMIWQGSGSIVVPGGVLLLALWNHRKGEGACASVATILLWFVIAVFAGLAVAAVEDLNFKWALRDPMKFQADSVSAYVIPVMISIFMADAKEKTKVNVTLIASGLLLSLIIRGIVPRIEHEDIGIMELSSSLEAFGKVLRVEAVTAMGLTVSLYCLATLLFSTAINSLKKTNLKKRKNGLWVVALSVIAGMLCKITISREFLGIGTMICWVIVPLTTQFIVRIKK